MQVIVTRPEREARQWVGELRGQGFDALALPLIEIGPAPDAQAVAAAWQRLGSFRALMFVSSNAVTGFFEKNRPLARVHWTGAATKTRAWAPGPGTREALLQAGVDPARVDSPPVDSQQFDSEALWRQVAGQAGAGDTVLIVRGADEDGQPKGRDWLGEQLARAGAQVESVAAYTRRCPALDTGALTQARDAAAKGAVWLFSSSQAIIHLQALLPGQDWAASRAVASHPRIAQAARDAGFGVVCESRPTLEAVIAALESIAC